jgi:hypothetical protein
VDVRPSHNLTSPPPQSFEHPLGDADKRVLRETSTAERTALPLFV